MKNVVFIAPPAAGKGTQSKKICAHYHVPHISVGDLLRDVSSSGTDVGKRISEKMKNGILIEDETMVRLIKDRFQQGDCIKGFILDGFPRNESQAILYDQLLEKLGKKVDVCIYLTLEYETLKNRIIGRVSCPECGHVFNESIESLKPKEKNICDFCHHSLIKREDDTEETFDKRFKTYQKETEPLIAYYKNKNILHTIDGTMTANEIFTEILNILEEGAS